MPEEEGRSGKQASPQPVMLEDPSEYRPELKNMAIGKEQDEFRIFTVMFFFTMKTVRHVECYDNCRLG